MMQFRTISVSDVGTPTEPVIVDDVKAWIGGLEGTTEFDTLIGDMITGARQTIEQYIALDLVAKNRVTDVENTSDVWDLVPLPYAKLASSVIVNKLDSYDQPTLLVVDTDYYLRGTMLRLQNGIFSVSYTTDPGTIPEALKEAIKMEVADRFANRGENQVMRANYESPSLGLSEGARAKAAPYQIPWL